MKCTYIFIQHANTIQLKRNGVAGPAEPSITATGDRPRLVSVAQLVRHAGRVSLAIVVVVVVEYY